MPARRVLAAMTGDRLIRADTATVVTAAARVHCGRRWWLLRVTMHVLEREAAEREQLGPAERREQLTSYRSAGRIESESWEAFLARCAELGLSHTDGMREMIRSWAGVPEPAPLSEDACSAAEVLSVS